MARSRSPARASASASVIFDQPVEIHVVLLRVSEFDAAAHVRRVPSPSVLPSVVAPPSRKSPNALHIGRSCSRAIRASSTAFGAAREWSPRISSNKADVHIRERMGADMRQVRDPRLGTPNERNRASDVAERPQRERQIGHRPNARVPSKAKRQIVVAPRLEQCQRAFQIIPRFAIVSGEPARRVRLRDGRRRPPANWVYPPRS